MLHQRRSLLGVVIIGCTGVLLAAGVGRASGDRPARVGAATAVELTDHATGKRRGDAPIRRKMAGYPLGCVDERKLNWVTTVQPLPECFYYDMHDEEDAEDWNGDGRVDFVDGIRGVPLTLSGAPAAPECIAVVTLTQWDGTAVSITKSCIADSEGLIAHVVQRFPGRSVVTGSAGWRDLDSDGDLDYVVQLVIDDYVEEAWAWLENTGYEANDGLAADLNGDGAVDGKDLTALLAAWTG